MKADTVREKLQKIGKVGGFALRESSNVNGHFAAFCDGDEDHAAIVDAPECYPSADAAVRGLYGVVQRVARAYNRTCARPGLA